MRRWSIFQGCPGEFKGPAFRTGHTICDEDLCHLQRLGKNHLYVIDLAEDEIHENEAVAILAGALAGEGVVWEDNPREGKINLVAGRDGLLSVDVAALASFNFLSHGSFCRDCPECNYPHCAFGKGV